MRGLECRGGCGLTEDRQEGPGSKGFGELWGKQQGSRELDSQQVSKGCLQGSLTSPADPCPHHSQGQSHIWRLMFGARRQAAKRRSLDGGSAALEDPCSRPMPPMPLGPHPALLSCSAQKIRQLAAVNQESKFRVLIQPGASFSVYSKAVSLEVGLQRFLCFLSSMRHPILACYKLWGPSLPHFFQALEGMNRLWEFQEAISGFLATLPLIRERVPRASSFKLKSLAKTYLVRNMSERSALATVVTMRDLCRLLDISPGPQLAQHIYSFSSLQCFASLQPLVQAAVLLQAEARLLALHNVSFMELLTAHRRDPQRGLKKYSGYLSPQTTSLPAAQPAFKLQALSTYFKGLLDGPALTRAEGASAWLTGHSLAERPSQQS